MFKSKAMNKALNILSKPFSGIKTDIHSTVKKGHEMYDEHVGELLVVVVGGVAGGLLLPLWTLSSPSICSY